MDDIVIANVDIICTEECAGFGVCCSLMLIILLHLYFSYWYTAAL